MPLHLRAESELGVKKCVLLICPRKLKNEPEFLLLSGDQDCNMDNLERLQRNGSNENMSRIVLKAFF